ncbi:MAG: methylthioribose-phosphate isomerase [Anaerophaga sp.]|nr:methylthioribose-phosphate isomerase [Anaerophaga sp.]
MSIDTISPVKWEGDKLLVLNQLKLPTVVEYNPKKTVEEVFYAIKNMELRGAPLIGISAAYGVVLGVKNLSADADDQFVEVVDESAAYLAQSRPTAVNLFWALERMKRKAREIAHLPFAEKVHLMEEEAIAIHREDEQNNRKIGENFHEAGFVYDGARILTHCNAGVLATSKYGTATSPMYLAHEKGWKIKVYADETRPYMQGARLTTFELHQAGIDVTLICDDMAGMVMSQGKVDMIITGADRIAANGDTANKIGTMSLAVMAHHFGIPFYIAAPLSTIDLKTPSGKEIPIEERSPKEVVEWFGIRTAPEGIGVFNPAFDVTPHELITAIVTEKGVVQAPFEENIRKLFNN